MAETPQIDMGAQLFARNQSGGGGAASGSGQSLSTEVDGLKAGADVIAHLFKVGAKMMLNINADAPEDGVGKSLSMTTGAPIKADGMIPSIMSQVNANGGFMARLMDAFKNSAITDQTTGVGGGAPIEAMVVDAGWNKLGGITPQVTPMPGREMEIGIG